MYSTFKSLSAYIKVRPNKISIDNFAFKFYYRATFLLLLVCTLLVTSRQYIGEHIRCITDKAVPEHVINTFCFFTTTFTVARHFNETLLEMGALPHPGIGPMHPTDDVKHHAYYQWVPFVLFGQALMFYLPHFLWRTWEGGRMKALVEGLQMIALSKHNKKRDEMRFSGNYVIPSQDTIDARMHVIKNEFYKHIKINKPFAKRLIFSEVLNVVNLVLQIYLTNRFLSGQFYSLGLDFINDDFTGRMDVLDVVFPKVTKCDFYKYGQSGSLQRHDALCVMALNIINEKIFVVLWFWYIIMIFVSIAGLIWRLITLAFSTSTAFNRAIFSTVCHSRINTQDLIVVTTHTTFSDWIFLYYLAKNMEPYLFTILLGDLAAEFRDHYNNEHEKLLARENLGGNSDKRNAKKLDDAGAAENIDEVDFRRK